MVEVGVSIKIGDVIACVETNKAMIEVEAMKEGIVFELKVNVGDVLQDNQVILIITTPDTHD
jgi:pyruvate/2-oxoglutarate dehydrogenase complex dihydrolipoamide acyltransferase (E2) component